MEKMKHDSFNSNQTACTSYKTGYIDHLRSIPHWYKPKNVLFPINDDIQSIEEHAIDQILLWSGYMPQLQVAIVLTKSTPNLS